MQIDSSCYNEDHVRIMGLFYHQLCGQDNNRYNGDALSAQWSTSKQYQAKSVMVLMRKDLWSILVAFWLWHCMVEAYRYYTDQLVGKVWVHVMVKIMGSLVVRYFVLWEQKHSEGNHLQYFYQTILTGECKWSYLRRAHACFVSIWFALWVMGMDWCRGNYLVTRTVRRVFATILQRFQYLVSSNQGLDQFFMCST